ncbi:hypothetical protein Hanom_Chr14g01317201 [Helianthus anomalus]
MCTYHQTGGKDILRILHLEPVITQSYTHILTNLRMHNTSKTLNFPMICDSYRTNKGKHCSKT